jgi:prepilin signal peptidase PulO-like enzyme (type II secretory pathway)
MMPLVGAVIGVGLGWGILRVVDLHYFDRYRPAGSERASSGWLVAASLVSASALYAYIFASGRPPGELALHLSVVAFLLLVAVVDWRYQIVPNALLYPAAALLLVGRLLLFGLADAMIALCAGAGGLGFFLLVAVISSGGIGGGDVKLAGVVGLLVSFPGVLWAVILAILTGGIVAILLVVAGRRDPLPYAPYLCIGALLIVIWDPLPWLVALTSSLVR